MKKTVCLILMLMLACTAVLGCGSKTEEPGKTEASAQPAPAVSESNTSDAEITEPNATLPPADTGDVLTTSDTNTLNDVRFVMIYNPNVWDENLVDGYGKDRNTTSLNTGSFGSQILTGLHRAGELEQPTHEWKKVSILDVRNGFDMPDAVLEGVRGGMTNPIYTKGNTHTFFVGTGNRYQAEFRCLYEGTNCYIWSLGDAVSEEQAERAGKTFDEQIYPTDVEYFGTPRFTEYGGKVNVLFYPMEGGLCGFFSYADIFSAAELQVYTQLGYDVSGYNPDHAIININSRLMHGYEDLAMSTLAHELQHQICASDAFFYNETPMMRAWLNESMSMYAEELNYPGSVVEDGYTWDFYSSNSFRSGQSLYDFRNLDHTVCGEYGAVYLFSKYIETHMDRDVYRKVHDYWRNSYSADITEASALYASVSETRIAEIDSKYSYPQSLSGRFASKEEEWMSKMTLDFYLGIVDPMLAGLTADADKVHLYMLYDEVNPVSIEGGGRVIIATQNGSYTIPDDADAGLIYIGFDENFNVVSMLYPNN